MNCRLGVPEVEIQEASSEMPSEKVATQSAMAISTSTRER